MSSEYFEDTLEKLMEEYEFDLGLPLADILADFYWAGVDAVAALEEQDEEVDPEEAES